MGELNDVPTRINKVEGAAGQVKLSGGPGLPETWGDLGSLTVPWTLESKLTPAGAANLDWASLAAHDIWLVVVHIKHDAGINAFYLRLNNDGGANYNYVDRTGVNLTANAAQNQIQIVSVGTDGFVDGQILIGGKTTGAGLFTHPLAFFGTGWAYDQLQLQGADWRSNADVSRITLYPAAGNITGTAALYYIDW